MTHFFISYSKKDTRELALALNDALNALPDISCWADLSLRAGRSWEAQIQTEINKCDFMVVLYSEDIHRHLQGEEESYVLTEIEYAKRYAKKPIIPVMVQQTNPPLSLIREHYIDYIGIGLSLQGLVEAICYETGITIAERHASPKTQPTQSGLARPISPLQELNRRTLEILPPPFEWIEIPAGKVTLITEKGWAANYIPKGKSQTFEVPAFMIAKYPVTNAQFAEFIKADGYKNWKWWTEAGWQQREQEKWTEPDFWQDKKWNGADYPVVGVSWYEAVAFCQWLSEASGEKIILPTEQQWQRAAQGDDGRIYLWGNNWDSSRCNTREAGIGKTTPVTQYIGKGDSPFGVVDMAGNVWEWCLTLCNKGSNDILSKNGRVVRGGSWEDGVSNARAAYRFGNYPFARLNCYGFRVVCARSLL